MGEHSSLLDEDEAAQIQPPRLLLLLALGVLGVLLLLATQIQPPRVLELDVPLLVPPLLVPLLDPGQSGLTIGTHV